MGGDHAGLDPVQHLDGGLRGAHALQLLPTEVHHDASAEGISQHVDGGSDTVPVMSEYCSLW